MSYSQAAETACEIIYPELKMLPPLNDGARYDATMSSDYDYILTSLALDWDCPSYGVLFVWLCEPIILARALLLGI